MLQQTDRLALAVPDAEKSAADLNAIFDSVVIDDSIDNDAHARRITLQWGYDQLELFEPIGDGPVAEFINEGKRGLLPVVSLSMTPQASLQELRVLAYQSLIRVIAT